MMKLARYISLLAFLTVSTEKKELRQLLRQQRHVLHTGLEGHAEVIHATPFNRYIGRLQQVQLWLKLKKTDGNYMYTHSNTLVNGACIPQCGHVVRIRYVPGKPEVVIIM
ncbi:hypothetical protein [Ferruginibacter sp.]